MKKLKQFKHVSMEKIFQNAVKYIEKCKSYKKLFHSYVIG